MMFQVNVNGVEVMGFCDDRDSVVVFGRGLLIDFFDQFVFNELMCNFCYVGGGKLVLFGNLYV